ncbi:hypothetical protein BRC65_01380 [Halobacteriales archaeon QH_2_65_14]|nr:MAG: hypothetical protein BRC65_01380 [Halobacteriales archaeon QH_2_65_14]
MRRRSFDYASWAKTGFLLGLGLFALGAGGGLFGPALFGELPEWETTLFLYSEVIGTVVGFFSVLLFGIVFPLLE